MTKPKQETLPARKTRNTRLYDRQAVSEYICEQIKLGRSLESICKEPGMPATGTFIEWVGNDDPKGVAADYARAREIGFALMAEEIIALADKTHEWVEAQAVDENGPVFDEAGEPVIKRVLLPLNAEMVAHKRLQVDTRKWMLSKMLPKVYGDKTTTELTGANGGPVAVAAVDMRALNDQELEQLQLLMSKAKGAGG